MGPDGRAHPPGMGRAAGHDGEHPRRLASEAPMLYQPHLIDADAVLRAGAEALQAGRHADALPATEAALRAYPRNVGLWHLAGLLHCGLENPAAALKAFRKASALMPEDGPIALAHAIAANEAGVPAFALLNRALKLAPDDGLLLLVQASALLSAGRVDEALEAVERRLEQR